MTKAKMEAAERPWEVFIHRDGSGIEVGPPYVDDSVLKGHVHGVASETVWQHERNDPKASQVFANLLFITRAANCYDVLVEACKAGTPEALAAALALTKVPVRVNYKPYPQVK